MISSFPASKQLKLTKHSKPLGCVVAHGNCASSRFAFPHVMACGKWSQGSVVAGWCTNFLQVAQEQLAEYASEKSAAASAILQQAEALEGTLQQLLAASSSSADAAGPDAVAAAMQQLKAQLMQAAVEAQAFAEQQQADVERAKRSSRQVGGGVSCCRTCCLWCPQTSCCRWPQLSTSPFVTTCSSAV
jgi:hypothetical protein